MTESRSPADLRLESRASSETRLIQTRVEDLEGLGKLEVIQPPGDLILRNTAVQGNEMN